MFREGFSLIRELGRELRLVFILFLIIPGLVILTIAGMITGITWKIILGLALAYVVFFIVSNMALYLYLKRWERKHQKEIQKEIEVKYVIIK